MTSLRSDRLRINTHEYGKRHPDRIVVGRLSTMQRVHEWGVWRGTEFLGSCRTHAEAIEWAQREARG